MKLKKVLEGMAWEREPGKPLPTLKDVAKKHNAVNEVDFSTMRLKSNIDQKWDSAKTMQNDLSQWIESTYAATGNVGDILKALEQVLTRTKNVSKEAPGQF